MKWRVFIGFVLFVSFSFSQEKTSLQTCLEKAKSNSIQFAVESGLLNRSRIDRQFHWWALLPDLSASAGINTSFGRRLDPFTNTFATSSVNSQSFGLNSSVRLFNGFSYFYKRNSLDASIHLNEISLNEKLNGLRIQVIETYVDLCKLSVQIQLAESRIEKFKQIQTIQRSLIREGRINAIDTLKSHNSVLVEQSLLLDLVNESKLKNIELNFQIGLPLRTNHVVDPVSISEIEEKPQFSGKYRVEALETELELVQNQLKSARSNSLPVVSMNGLVGTGFSTNNKDYSQVGSPTKPYSDQINQNLYEGIGFSLTIPIFNKGEWLKMKQLSKVQQAEVIVNKQLAEHLLEKQQLEREQKQLNNKAKQEQIKQTANNLQIIYTKSLLLYEAGRLTYTEMETTLMDWQLKLSDYELLKIESEILKLYE